MFLFACHNKKYFWIVSAKCHIVFTMPMREGQMRISKAYLYGVGGVTPLLHGVLDRFLK